MKKRLRRSEAESSETLISRSGGGADETRKELDGGGFFACYLLASLSPRHKGHTYIGFTVNPRRRIRQHNGEITSGAWRTKSKRPWEMVLCIYGFPTNVAALQFEWAWQHPTESLAVRKAAASFKTLSGIANKIKLAYTMLTLSAWQSLNLTVNFFSTKYTKHSAGCPCLPANMKVQVCMMDDLPCYVENVCNSREDEDDLTDDEESDRSSSSDGNIQQEMLRDFALNQFAGNWTNDMCNKKFGESKENYIRQPRESFVLKDQKEQFCSSSFPAKAVITSIRGLYSSEETLKDKEDIESKEECSSKVGSSTPEAFQAAAGDQQPFSCIIPQGIEVIDISTPSTDCRVSLSNKKRRLSATYPQIIDLTRSPIFVQL